jgi:hypothetical protein
VGLLPSGATIATAWMSVAQSTPAVGAGAGAVGVAGRAGMGGSVTLIVVSSLLAPWEDTRWSRGAAAGRSLIGARRRTAL